MKALGRTDVENQNKIVKFGGIRPLVRLLCSPKTSKLVLLVVIRVLGSLCVGRWQHLVIRGVVFSPHTCCCQSSSVVVSPHTCCCQSSSVVSPHTCCCQLS